jgi:hypothetical protein
VYDVRLTRQFLDEGYSSGEIARLTRLGALHRLRRGAYDTPSSDPINVIESHRRLIHASKPYLASGSVVSHASAAVLHDLVPYATRLDRVQLTRPDVPGGKSRRLLDLHAAPLGLSEIVEVDGVPATSIARTVADLARALTFEPAVVVGDSALRAGLDRAALLGCLERMRRWPGVIRARRVAAFIDGHSESAGESRSRAGFLQSGIAAPELQLEVFDDYGRFAARVDFAWKPSRTIGEFDGKIKYGRELNPAKDSRDVVYQEKLREDLLRELGWQVVRWTWADLDHPDRIAARLRRAFARSHTHRPQP